MESSTDKSAPNNVSDKHKDRSSNDNQNNKKTNKEIREEYFNQLRCWLATVNSYQCFYNELQQKSLQSYYQQVPNNTTEVPKDNTPNTVPEVVPETQTTEPNHFAGMFCSQIHTKLELFDTILLKFI
jgi:hypothetical protein